MFVNVRNVVGVLHRQLQILKEKQGPDDIFGNIDFVFVGDWSQLASVGSPPVYECPGGKKGQTNTNDVKNNDMLGYEVYSSINTVITLTEAHRFKDDKPFGVILQAFHDGLVLPSQVLSINSRVVNGTTVTMPADCHATFVNLDNATRIKAFPLCLPQLKIICSKYM